MQSALLPAVPPGLSVRDCGAGRYASGQTACPVGPTLRQSRSCHSQVSPLHLVTFSAPPTGLDECLFFISLVSDPLAVRFSVSSGCARRHSVSTYAAILVLPSFLWLNSIPLCKWPIIVSSTYLLVITASLHLCLSILGKELS